VKSLANRYPTLKALIQISATNNFVIPPGFPGAVIKVHSGDNVSIETQTQSEEVQAITAETQEGELLQTGGAPVTATPEDETGMDELTEGQENILWEQVAALLRAIQEMKL
jgi:hypothetical protein